MLEDKRKKIDEIDEKIVNLLGERTKAAEEIGKEKKQTERDILDSQREQQVIDHAKAIAEEKGLEGEFIEEIFKKIMHYSKEKQRKL
ncbi:chorismate mutase [Nanoarchaeota archaeon]